MNIFLIGFMGTGKSTISAVLGKELSTEVIEMDELIVKRQGMPISQIFETRGEEYFREFWWNCSKGTASSFPAEAARPCGSAMWPR